MEMKFVIDTDIGDDIDDAFALDFALKRNLDLVCVTTVFRNTVERARIAKKMLALYGRDLPVYAGCGIPLSGDVPTCEHVCQWTKDLENFTPDAGDAVDAILHAARRYGKELVILAIGPLTNLARAIEKDPAAMEGIGGIVLMGGDFVNHYAEWNIRCDVPAAERVFSSGVPITAFGHEITSQTRLSPREQHYVMNMKQDPYHAYLAELSRLWYASKPDGWLIVLHDVMVARYASEPSYCSFRSAPVAVETEGEYTAGMTVDLSLMGDYHYGEGKPVHIAEKVDIREMIDCFLRTVGYYGVGAEESGLPLQESAG